MNFNAVRAILSVWKLQGLQHVVISSGSRSAPLALAAARIPGLELHVHNDERAAAFMALGMAQASGKPVMLICTSGTAGLNFSPAIAEAHYQQIPLLVCTADRPTEWIDQWDGQTLRQQNLFGDRVNAFFQLPDNLSHPDAEWYINRLANDAWWQAMAAVKGPVHLNFPFREPFYPDAEEGGLMVDVRIMQQIAPVPLLGKYLAHDLINHWLATEKKLVVVGQGAFDHELNNVLYANQHYNGAPLITDIISNASQIQDAISTADLILMQDRPELQPDLLVTIGSSIISKNLKLALRKWKPKQHWHIQPDGHVADVFQSLTHIIRTSPAEFIQRLGEQGYFTGAADNKPAYYMAWQQAQAQVKQTLVSVATTPQDGHLTDLVACHQVMQALPDDWHLHLANSMSVRYGNFIGLKAGNRNQVWANRGTSGIDGCTSTAIGHAKANQAPALLLTGDVAFFYDRNAFWQEHLPANLKVVLLNNSGGNIFSMIDGPAKQPEHKQLFQTWQQHSAGPLCKQAGVAHREVKDLDQLPAALEWLWLQPNMAVLEVLTISEASTAHFKALKQAMQQL